MLWFRFLQKCLARLDEACFGQLGLSSSLGQSSPYDDEDGCNGDDDCADDGGDGDDDGGHHDDDGVNHVMVIIKLVLPNLAPYSSLGQSSPEVFGLGASVMNRTMGWFFDANQRLWSRWGWQCKSFSWTSGLWDYLELDTRAQRWWVVRGSLTVGVTRCFGTVSIKQWSGFQWDESRSFGIGNKSFNFSSTHFWSS